MISYIKNILTRHLSLLVISIGALSFFLSNIIMKDVFSSKQYGYYSVFVTYLSVIYLLGILGLEQTFLRFSQKFSKNIIETQRIQLFIFSIVSFVTTILASYVFIDLYTDIPINKILLFFSSFSMISLLFLFNILRLNDDFILSQVVSNYWKFILLLISICFYIFNYVSLELYLTILALNVVFIFIISIAIILNKIQIIYCDKINKKEIFISFFHFFLGIVSFTALTFSDRLLVEHKFSIEQFGDYFYLTNFFLAPYSILQNYIGFKQLVFFKNKFTIEYYKKNNLKALYLGLALAFFLFFLSKIIIYFDVVKFNFNDYKGVICLLLLMGILRLYSSSILSAFEARTTIKYLMKSNLIITSITFFVFLIVILFFNSLEEILISFIFIWFSRSIVHNYLLFKQFKEII